MGITLIPEYFMQVAQKHGIQQYTLPESTLLWLWSFVFVIATLVNS
jgi:hypothetical protein